MKPSIEELQSQLRIGFPQATCIEVIDDSAAHAGHAGAQGGGGHFRVRIDAPQFAGLRPVARHRLVYDCLADWIPARIHALSMTLSVSGDGK